MISSKQSLRTAVLAFAITCLCMVGASATSLGVATVEADALRLRESADASSTILATASKGTAVVVLEDAGNNWYKVDYQTVEGYMLGDYLTVSTTADVTIGYGVVSTDGATLNMRSGPATTYDKVATLSNGTVVSIVGIADGWYKISYNNATGYVSSEYMLTAKDSSGSRGDGTTTTTTVASSSVGAQVVALAKNYLGYSYVYGASGPYSFDCSGFTSYVYKQFGYTLNRSAADQLSNGVSVAYSDLQPGDLIFFRNNTTKAASHVGIYIGSGQFIHASTNTYQVIISDLSGYYSNIYVGARRIL